MQKVLKELEDVIKTIGEKDKYGIILEKQAGILFSSPALDITDKVIAAYNDAVKKKPSSSPPPKK